MEDRVAKALLALLLSFGVAPCGAQTAAVPFRTTITGKAGPYFAGEPVYLLITVRNTDSVPRAVLKKDALARDAILEVHDSAGRSMERTRSFVDVIGPVQLDTLAPGDSLLFVWPIHWFFGSRPDTTIDGTYCVFEPGRYRAEIVFPQVNNVAGASLDFVVRPRTVDEERGWAVFRAWVTRANVDVRVTGVVDSALGSIRAAYQDPSLAAFRLLLLLDVASPLIVQGRGYSPTYRPALDVLRRDLLRTTSGAERVRLQEVLESNP